ncbi:MAG: ABC transporter ATP-binding protein [Euryarchaeota archaeon]|nr:ABC transporter ATP-binding protein [Euryarchaeota archaeon]
MGSMMKTKNLTKIFTMGKEKIYAVNEVDLEIYEGEILVILGASGSGKTTLLSLLGGLDRPSNGHIYFKKNNFSSFSEDKLAKLRRKEIGFIFQFYNLLEGFSAFENIKIPMNLVKTPREEAKEKAWDLLEAVGLKERAYHNSSELSGGEQQRVAIARALANNPAIIFADEPTGNLDSKTGAQILRLIKKLNEDNGQTFVIVTHDTSITEIADRVLQMKDGRISDAKISY